MKWFITVAAILLTLILVGWGLSALARNIFGGSSDSTRDTTRQTVSKNEEKPTSVKFTVDGPIVATSEHYSYTIEVSNSVVMMKLYTNYGTEVYKEKSYTNNDSAYQNFIAAVDNAGATERIKGTITEDDQKDKGKCPTGERLILDYSEDVRRWTTTCNGVNGTGGSNISTIRDLFDAQIPEDDFESILEDTDLD